MEWIRINSDEDVKIFFEAQGDARRHAYAIFIASRAALRYASDAISFYEFDNYANERRLTSLTFFALFISFWCCECNSQ